MHPEARRFLALLMMIAAVGWFLFELAMRWPQIMEHL